MRKLYDEFFYIPKHGKIREKVMLTRMATTIVIMVVCLAAMGITAYAYFSYNVTSGPNTIKAADFEANVLITGSDAKTVPLTKDGKIQSVTLEAGDYEIELSKAASSTADKGFCVITIGDEKYYTDQIGVDAEKKLDDAKVEFELSISAPTKVEVLSHWGTSVYYDYNDAERTEIFIETDDTIDRTAKTSGGESGESEEGADSTDETAPTPPTDTTTPTTDAESSAPATDSTTDTTPSTEPTTPEDATSESATTTEPSGSATDSVTQPTDPADTETPSTETTEETETPSNEITEETETPPATETSETAGEPAAEATE